MNSRQGRGRRSEGILGAIQGTTGCSRAIFGPLPLSRAGGASRVSRVSNASRASLVGRKSSARGSLINSTLEDSGPIRGLVIVNARERVLLKHTVGRRNNAIARREVNQVTRCGFRWAKIDAKSSVVGSQLLFKSNLSAVLLRAENSGSTAKSTEEAHIRTLSGEHLKGRPLMTSSVREAIM